MEHEIKPLTDYELCEKFVKELINNNSPRIVGEIRSSHIDVELSDTKVQFAFNFKGKLIQIYHYDR